MIESWRMANAYCDGVQADGAVCRNGLGQRGFDIPESVMDAKQLALEDGWRFIGKKVYCPDCIADGFVPKAGPR